MVVGVLALLVGLVWAAQGAGYFPYPSTSFMINESRWIYIGLAVAAGGVIAVAVSRAL